MSIQSVYTLSRDDPEARSWAGFLRRHGYPKLSQLVIERVFWLEGAVDAARLQPLLVNLLYQTAAERSMLEPARGPIVEVAYRPAVTDPEMPSILAGARALGQTGLEFVRLSRRYQFVGLSEGAARQAAAQFLYNSVVERVREPEDVFVSLRPSGQPDPVRTIALAGLSNEELCALSQARSWYAPLAQMRVIQTHEIERGRPHTDAEIEILAQSWSDHCYHTTWKSLGLLERLASATAAIRHPLVVSAFRDNAGAMEFYDDWCLTIKGETHNFPTSIAPFGGISTKHGGVIRDTLGFGKGAYPIGGTTIMGTMDPRQAEDAVPVGALHPRLVVSESVRGTAYYLNPMGIPMMHPLYRIHPGFAKCFALGHSVGLIPKMYALKDALEAGDAALLIGGETGRDGIHGATASSTGMSDETRTKESAAVQIGHPITERKFTTAIPVLRDAGCIRAITDLGAGGISSAAGEMAAQTGVALDLDRVPLKDQSLTAWEILLSESQERMLVAVPGEKLAESEAILDRYEVEHVRIGHFNASGRFEASWRGEKVVDLEMAFLWNRCPLEPRTVSQAERQLKPLTLTPPQTQAEWSRAIHGVVGHYHCADQSAAGSRFDSTVQGRTVVGPYGGKSCRMPTNLSVLAPLRGKPYGAVMTVAFNPFYGEISPAAMARLMVIEAITKAVVAGVDYREMVLCDNFYTPRVRPEVAWDLREMVEAIAEFSLSIGVPFISGKDSSSGTFESAGRQIEVPPTLAVAALGRMPDVSRVVTKEFKRAGHKLVLLGHSEADALGGSVYADSHGQRGERLFDGYDAMGIRALWDALLAWHRKGRYVSGSAIAEGGMLVRLFEAALGSGLGAQIDLSAPAQGLAARGESHVRALEGLGFSPAVPALSPQPLGNAGAHFAAGLKPSPSKACSDGLLFGEFVGSVLLEVEHDRGLDGLPVPYRVVGEVLEQPHLILIEAGREVFSESIASLETTWTQTFREVLE